VNPSCHPLCTLPQAAGHSAAESAPAAPPSSSGAPTLSSCAAALDGRGGGRTLRPLHTSAAPAPLACPRPLPCCLLGPRRGLETLDQRRDRCRPGQRQLLLLLTKLWPDAPQPSAGASWTASNTESRGPRWRHRLRRRWGSARSRRPRPPPFLCPGPAWHCWGGGQRQRFRVCEAEMDRIRDRQNPRGF
jgi:hypothetical protein